MKERIITAIVMLAVAIPVILIGGLPAYFLVALLALQATRELINIISTKTNIPLLVKVLSYVATIYFVFYNINLEPLPINIEFNNLYFVILVFVALMGMVFIKDFTIEIAGYLLLSVLYVGYGFHGLAYIYGLGLNYIIFILLIIIFTDTFAYFFGRKLGKHKLAPVLSPKKSVEGSIFGTLFGTLIGVIFGLIFNIIVNPFILIAVAFGLSIIGQIGDLVASSIKRAFGVKDYSNIFPGHGGVLDRLDSILFSSMALFVFFELFGQMVM